MNDRIKQLTRNYLNSFYSLNGNQKKKIIEVNSQTEWGGSLQAKKLETEGYKPMLYVDERDQIFDTFCHTYVFKNIRDYIKKYWDQIGLVSPTSYELGDLEEYPDDYDRLQKRKVVYGYLRTHAGGTSPRHIYEPPPTKRMGIFLLKLIT